MLFRSNGEFKTVLKGFAFISGHEDLNRLNKAISGPVLGPKQHVMTASNMSS